MGIIAKLSELIDSTTLSRIEGKIDANEKRRRELRNVCGELALRAEAGDAKAQAELKKRDDELVRLEREHVTLTAARAEVYRLDDEKKAEAARLKRQADIAEARSIADAIMVRSIKIDEHLTQVGFLLDERAELIGRLRRYQVFGNGAINALERWRRIAGALGFAGIAKHLGPDFVVNPTMRQKLSEADALALSPGHERAEENAAPAVEEEAAHA